jgi:hypothetical protein
VRVTSSWNANSRTTKAHFSAVQFATSSTEHTDAPLPCSSSSTTHRARFNCCPLAHPTDVYSADVVAVLSDDSFRSIGPHQYVVHACKDCFKIGKMPPVIEMLWCAKALASEEVARSQTLDSWPTIHALSLGRRNLCCVTIVAGVSGQNTGYRTKLSRRQQHACGKIDFFSTAQEHVECVGLIDGA